MKKKLLIAATILLASTLSAFQLRTVDFENFTPGNGAPTAPDDQGFFWYTFENGSFGTDAFSNSVISVGPQQVGAGQALLLGDATEGTFTSGSFYGTGTFSSGPDSDLVDFANSDTPSTTLSMSIIWSPQSGGSDDQSFTFYTYDAVDFDSGTPEINNHSPLRIKNDGSIVLLDPSNNFSEEPLNVSLVADQQYLFYIRHDYSTKLWDAFLISGGEKIDLITQRAFTASGITNSESLITIETSFTAGDNGEGGNDLLIIDNIIAWAVESRPTRANIDLNISYNFDAFVDGGNNLFATGAPASFGGFAFGTTSLLHESGYTGIVQGGALDSIGQAGYIGGTEETFANVGTIGGATIFGGYVDQPAFHVFDLNTPVVSFSADLRIEPAAERRSAEKVFVSLFDPLASDDISRGAGYAFLEFASDGNIYFRNGPQNFVTNGTPTGQSYLNNNNYRAVITVDYLRQRWSATLEDLESGGDTVTLVDDEPVDASGWINAYTSANIQLFYSDTENASFPETLVYFDNLEVRPEDTGGDLLSNITLATDYEDYPLGNGPPQDPDGWHPHSAYFFGANATSTADFLNDSVVRVEDREFTQFGEPVTSRVTVIGGESSSLTFIPDGEPDGGFVGIATFPTAPTTADNPAYNFGNSDTPVLDIQIDFAFFPDQESTAFQQWEFFIYDPGPDPENPGFFPHSGVVVNHNGGVAVRDDHSDFMNQVDIDDLTLDDGELYRLIMRIDYENSTWSAWIQDFDGGVTQIADKRSHTASGLTSPTGAMNVQVGSAVDSNGNAASGEVIFDNWIVRAVPSASTDIIQPFSVDFEDFTEGENNIFRRSPALRPFDGWRTSGSPATPYNDGIAGIIEGDDNPINDTKGGFLGGLDDAGNAGDSIGLYSGYLRGSYHNIITNGPITKTMEMDFYFDPVDGATSELTFYKYDGNDPSAVGNTTGTFHSLIIIAADGAISVADSSSSPAVDTGLSIALRTPYRLIMELDYDNLVWSASIQNLDTEAIIVVADERSFSASGWVATRDGVSMIISDDLSAKLYFDNMIIKFNEEAERSNVLASVDFETYTIGDGAASGQAGDPEFELGAFGSPATFPNSVSSIEADPATGDRSLVFGDMTGGTFSSSDFHGIGSFTPEVPSRVIDIANSSTPSVTRTVAFTWSPQLGGSDTQVFWFSVTDPMDLANSASFTLHSAIQIDSDGSLSIVDRLGESDSVSLGVTLSPDVEYTLYIRNDYSSMRWDAFIDSPAEGQIDLVTQRSFEASGLIDPEAVLSVDTAFTAEGDGLVGNDLLIVDNMFSWAVPTHPSRANIDLNVSYDFESFTTGVNELFTGGTTDSFGGFAYGTTTLAPSSGYTGIAESTALDPDGKVAFLGGSNGSFANRQDFSGILVYGGYLDTPVFHAFDLNTPVVSYSVDFRIEPATTRRSEENLVLYLFDPADPDDIATASFFAYLRFDEDGDIDFRNTSSDAYSSTGQTYLNNNNYRVTITVDHLRKRWSATLEDLDGSGTVTLVDEETSTGSGWMAALGSLDVEFFQSETDSPALSETVIYLDNYAISAPDASGTLLSRIIIAADYEDYPLGNGPPQDPDGWHPHSAFFFGGELAGDTPFYQDNIVRVEDREFTQSGAPVTSRAMVIGGESTTLDFPPNGFAGIGVFPSAQSSDSFDFKNSDTPVLDVQIDFAFFPDQEEHAPFQQWEFFMYDPGPDLENPGFFPHSTVKITSDGAVAVRDEFFDFAGETFIPNFSLDSEELYRLIMRIDYERQQWSAWIQDFDGGVTQIADKRSMNASGITSITSGMDVQASFSIDGDGNVPTGEIIIESWDNRAVPQDTTPVAASKLVNFEDFTEGPDNLFRRSPALQPFDGFRSIGSGASVLTSGIASVVTNNPINGTQGGRLGGIEDTPDGNFKFFGVFGNYQNSPYINLLDNGITEKKIEVDFYFDPVQDGSTGVTFYKFGANASSVFANAPANFNAIVTFGTNGKVSVADDFNSGFVDTGIVLSLETPYKITFDYNYGAQTWSASIRDLLTDMESVLATNRSFPASGWIGVGDLLTIQITNDYRGELYFDNIGVTYSDGLGDAQSFGDITGGETWSDVTAFSSELGMGGISRNASGETEPAIRLDEKEPFTTITGLSFDSPKVEVADFIVIDGADRPIVNTFDTDGNEIAFFIDASDVPQGISAPSEIGRSPEEVKITGGFDEFGATPALLTGSAVKNIEGDRSAFTWTSATGSILIDLPTRYRSTEPTAFSQSSGYIVGYGTLETGGQEIWILDVDGNTISIIDNIPGSAPQVWPTIIDIVEGKLTVLGYHKETPNRFSKPFIWNSDDGFTSFGAPATFDEFVPKAYIGDGILVGQARAHAPLNGGNAYNQNSETDAQWRPFIFRMDDENYAPFRVALETAGKLPEGWTASTIDYSDGSFFGRSINPNGDIEGYAVALHPNTLSAAFNRASVPVLESVPSYAQSEPLASEAVVQSVFSGVSKYMEASWTLDGGPLAGNANTPSANGANGTYQVRFSDTRDILAQSVTQGEVIHSISELTISDSGLTAAARDALGLAPSETPSRRQLSQIVDLQAGGQSISDLTGIGEMPNITVLDLSENQISDTDPLSELTKLRELDLSGNPLAALAPASATKSNVTTKNSDPGPLDFLAQTNDLEGLDLSSTGLDSVDELADAPSLRAVTIADNPITDVTVIASLPQIAQIDLSGTSVTNLSPLSTVTTIEEVDLSDTNIDDLSALENAPLLQELDISNTDVTDLSALENAPLLQELDISDTEISDLSALANAPSLKELDLANTQVTDLSALGSVADNIEEIELGGTPITNILALVNADLDFLKMPGVDSASDNLNAIAQKLAEGSRILVDPTDESFLPSVFDAYSNVIALEIDVPLLQSYRLEEIANLNDRQAGDVPNVQIDSNKVYLFVDPSASAGEARFFRMIGE